MAEHDFLTASRDVLEQYARGRAEVMCTRRDSPLALVRVLGEWVLWVDTRDESVSAWLMTEGFYESWITLAMARYLRPGMYCIDVGANCGYYTALMAGLVGKTGRVLAVEPNPELAHVLIDSIAANGWQPYVSVSCRAAWSTTGSRGTLLVDPAHAGGASMADAAVEGMQSYATEMAAVDDLVAHWPKVDLVKVDVEGSEAEVWRGMRLTLARNPHCVVVLEVSNDRGYDGRCFYEELICAGYPLAEVGYGGDVRSTTVPGLASIQGEGQWAMLWLQRRHGNRQPG
jgi:FkbM family methyltransferase